MLDYVGADTRSVTERNKRSVLLETSGKGCRRNRTLEAGNRKDPKRTLKERL